MHRAPERELNELLQVVDYTAKTFREATSQRKADAKQDAKLDAA